MLIQSIRGREILDSRGSPTVEAEVILENGQIGRASVPSGASTGSLEACELRDGDTERYNGRGVQKAVLAINGEINKALSQKSIANQSDIDHALCELDGTPNKSRLGANAILAVSLGAARARALSEKRPLYESLNEGETPFMPIPMMNILNGGAHANNSLDIQEFMILPIGASSFKEALRMGAEIFNALKKILSLNGMSTAVGDEGGFAPSLTSNESALDLLVEATVKAGYELKKDIVFALDVAASELFSEGYYHLASEKKSKSAGEMVLWYENLIQKYPIVSIEDGLHESDWEGWRGLTERLHARVQLVGDDLFVTNPKMLEKGIKEHVANALLVKLNQIGTLTETREAMRLAKRNDYRTVISHRSGETEDTFIADFAVASGASQIKTGALSRTDRIAKYNQLLRIEENAAYPYAQIF